MKNITLVGNSIYFYKLIKLIYPDSIISIQSWRAIKKNYKKNPYKIDIIIVCGYDYLSYGYNFNEFVKSNVVKPLGYLKAHASVSTRIIYINTAVSSKNVTYSRYEYAKNLLAYSIKSKFKSAEILSLPLILDDRYFTPVKGGVVSRYVIKKLISHNLIKTINTSQIIKLLENNRNNSKSNTKIPRMDGRLLSIPRNQFIDRILRLSND
jgi:hypothetical protein